MMVTFDMWRACFPSWSSISSIFSWSLAPNGLVRRTLCLTIYLFVHYSFIPEVLIEPSVGHNLVVV